MNGGLIVILERAQTTRKVAATTNSYKYNSNQYQAILGAHARTWSLASLGTEPETGAKWIYQMVQNKFLKAPDRD